jgi:hypothetical protein
MTKFLVTYSKQNGVISTIENRIFGETEIHYDKEGFVDIRDVERDIMDEITLYGQAERIKVQVIGVQRIPNKKDN